MLKFDSSVSYMRIVVILILSTMIFIVLLYGFQKWQRNYLFCELIKPGMPLSEALIVINQNGEFGVEQFDNQDHVSIQVVPYANWKTAIRYGDREIELSFRKNIFVGAIERYRLEDGIRPLCE
jgi:hypothetical protein